MRFRQEIQAVSRQAELTRIDVVAGILRDEHERVLLAERVGGGPFNGLWEFPGGKIRDGESPVAALERELREEIGIDAGLCELYQCVDFDYPDKRVAIRFYLVSEWQGNPHGLEGQQLSWKSVGRLNAAELLPANKTVVELLKRECAA